MKIFLVRHGETTANVGDNYISRVPDHLVPLTDNGAAQANAAGKWLAGYCAQNSISLENARIWRSPYQRTRQTSEAFNTHLNIDSVFEDFALVEMQYGLFDSLHENEWKQKFPTEYAECKRQWDSGGKFYLRFPNGESPFDVALRVHQFMGTIKRDTAERTARIENQELDMRYVIEVLERDGVPGSVWPTPNYTPISSLPADSDEPLMYLLRTKEKDFAQRRTN